MKPDLSVELAGIKLKNPVLTASGTFGSGREYSAFVDLNEIGALITKTMTLEKRVGNPPPRIWETAAGLLNSIGLQNDGVDHWIRTDLPFLRKFDLPVIVSIAGKTVEEYATLCKKLSGLPGVEGIEINISCPNVKAGGLLFGQHPELAAEVTSACRYASKLPIIVKLSPNVTNIVPLAKSVVRSGADALSLINTVLGMAIDVDTFKPALATVTGGLSGPAIKPIAVRMVWEVARVVEVPVIGMGGIVDTRDAVEFMLAGASAVAIGTASFITPETVVNVVKGLEAYLTERNISSVSQIVGKVAV